MEAIEGWNWMETIITVLATAITTFLAAYIGARLAYKNTVRQKYYEHKTSVYLELSRVLPVLDDFYSQSDYFYGYEMGGSAETKIANIDARIEATEENLKIVNDAEQQNELKTEISNLKYIRKKHEEYLSERKKLFDRITEFKESGHENELRLFASSEVWHWYIGFLVSLENEYKTDIGVTNDDIVHNMRRLIKLMRNDLKKTK